MEQSNNSEILYIRITEGSIMLASEGTAGPWFEPQMARNGISPAVNVREILRKNPNLTNEYQHICAIVDMPVMLLPEEDFTIEGLELNYKTLFPSEENIMVEFIALDSLKSIAVFGVNKDLKTTLNDNFKEVKIVPLMYKTWEYFNSRSYGKNPEKVYAYLHEGRMEVCAFVRNRFHFCNTFEVLDIHDALFYILGVWKHIGFNKANGELFLAGNHEEWDWLTSETRKFIPHTYHINPSADFNRAPATGIEEMPFDMMLEFVL